MAVIAFDPIPEADYQRLALNDPQGVLELHRGRLRERPGMSVEHGDVMELLLERLYRQLDRGDYRLRVQHACLRISSDTYYIPDVAVIAVAMSQRLRERPSSLDAYPGPLPLVVEIWSPSTGDYDVNEKLAHYQRRGDQEIWRVHPYERTLTAWRRQPGGTYAENLFREGWVQSASLSGVTIDLAALFAP